MLVMGVLLMVLLLEEESRRTYDKAHGCVLQYSCVGEMEFVCLGKVSCSLYLRCNGDCILSNNISCYM